MLYVSVVGANLSVMDVRSLVDGGLLLLVLISLAFGIPFTLVLAVKFTGLYPSRKRAG